MNDIMKKFFRSSILTSLLLVILGILLVAFSDETIIAISYFIGGVLVLIGVVGIIDYVRKIKTNYKSELDLIYGIVTIILGVLIITHPKSIASIINYVLGVIIIINSASKFNYSLQLRNSSNNIWKTTMLVSILTGICGIVLIFNPFKTASAIISIIGIIIIVYGVLDIVSTIFIKRNYEQLTNPKKKNNKTKDATIVKEEDTEQKEIEGEMEDE
jgi:uncharacterized membrane protein HdeD (DUF308 family)